MNRFMSPSTWVQWSSRSWFHQLIIAIAMMRFWLCCCYYCFVAAVLRRRNLSGGGRECRWLWKRWIRFILHQAWQKEIGAACWFNTSWQWIAFEFMLGTNAIGFCFRSRNSSTATWICTEWQNFAASGICADVVLWHIVWIWWQWGTSWRIVMWIGIQITIRIRTNG